MRHYVPAIDGLRAVAPTQGSCFSIFFPKKSPVALSELTFFRDFRISRHTHHSGDRSKQGQFSFKEFYERRIRRLLPALLTVLLVTTLAALAVGTRDRHLRTASLLRNILFLTFSFFPKPDISTKLQSRKRYFTLVAQSRRTVPSFGR